MRLRDVFVELLRKKGIETVSTNLSKILESKDVLQMMAVLVALGKANVCEGCKGKSFDLNGRVVDNAQVFVGRCNENVIISRKDLISEARKNYFPYLVIDCSFFDKHTEKEKRKVLFQIHQTLGVVRKYMWDEKLIITALNCGIGVYYPTTADFIKENEINDIILLDPFGEELFNGEKAECFIIGGIVDKSGNKTGWTSRIGEMLKREGIEFRSMRIELRGDIIGVPDRINTIAELVLKVVLDGKDVETAIGEVQSPLVARWRLRKELPKLTIRVDVNGRPFRVIRKSEFEKFDWLNIDLEDFYNVCSELGYIVLDDRKLDELISNAKWDERKKRYII